MNKQQFTLHRAGLSRQIRRVRCMPSAFLLLMRSNTSCYSISLQQKNAIAFRIRRRKTRPVFQLNKPKKSFVLALGFKQRAAILNY